MINDKDFDELMKLNPFTKTEYYPIKNKVLNGLLGGQGLPKGSILHIAAGSGTGKSTLALKDICLDLLKQGQDIAYIDADRGVNSEILESTGVATYLGNRDRSKGGCFMSFRKSTFHEINDLVQDLVAKGITIIVIDTLSVIDSGMYMGKDAYNIENMRVGGEAQKLRQLMKNLNVLAEQDSRRVNFILLNHTAKEIGGFSFGAPKETPKGGEAPIQYSDIVIQLYKYSDKSETFNDKPIGQKVYAQIVKSRYITGKVKTPFFIRYGKGISNLLTYKEIFESGKAVDGCFIEAKGRTYYLRHPKLEEDIHYVGKDNLLDTLIKNYQTIDALFSPKDWIINTEKEAETLDIEFAMNDVALLPKGLQDKKVVTVMNGNVYFLKGIDIYGQNYAIYYNTSNKKLIKEYNSGMSFIGIKDLDKSIEEVQKYVDDVNKEENEKSIEEKLDSVDI